MSGLNCYLLLLLQKSTALMIWNVRISRFKSICGKLDFPFFFFCVCVWEKRLVVVTSLTIILNFYQQIVRGSCTQYCLTYVALVPAFVNNMSIAKTELYLEAWFLWLVEGTFVDINRTWRFVLWFSLYIISIVKIFVDKC